MDRIKPFHPVITFVIGGEASFAAKRERTRRYDIHYVIGAPIKSCLTEDR